ncbi:hypothetical protein YYC_05809 [Plasmodium yoelii 17X]|uniref:Uncharacterized protein n=1 Tax=Plasmodium yoelii 17X TaxID=1323249 RepID=V7PBL0_PLAYE|nr:hypothetical protein YYC_05809 [Plasmodium yoelii 17X]
MINKLMYIELFLSILIKTLTKNDAIYNRKIKGLYTYIYIYIYIMYFLCVLKMLEA